MKKDKVTKFKKAICKFLKEWGPGVSFVELSKHIAGFKSKKEPGWDLQFCKNLVVWVGMTEEAVEAIIQLRAEKRIILTPTIYSVYLFDGEVLKFPLAKRFMAYKKPRWVPTVLNLTSKGKK